MVQTHSITKPVLVISGATATGKSDLAINLAKILNGEIISADSMQIYKKMDIGTAKVSQAIRKEIPHHLMNIKNIDENYSVVNFKDDAEHIINKLHSKNKLPIIVGGTGLYINSLLFDYSFENKTDIKKQPKQNFYVIVLQLPREEMYERIHKRVDQMMQKGLLQEINKLLKAGATFEMQSMKAIGYKEFKSYIEQKETLEKCILNLKQYTRNYAKRQVTWFKQWASFAHFINAHTPTEEVLEKIKEDLKI